MDSMQRTHEAALASFKKQLHSAESLKVYQKLCMDELADSMMR
jgi:hypothetical protein